MQLSKKSTPTQNGTAEPFYKNMLLCAIVNLIFSCSFFSANRFCVNLTVDGTIKSSNCYLNINLLDGVTDKGSKDCPQVKRRLPTKIFMRIKGINTFQN